MTRHSVAAVLGLLLIAVSVPSMIILGVVNGLVILTTVGVVLLVAAAVGAIRASAAAPEVCWDCRDGAHRCCAPPCSCPFEHDISHQRAA